MRRTHVDLFSGIGGFALACRWAGVETIAFAETDDYASQILKRHWPNVSNYGDVRDVPVIRSVWLVSGGVPCQPASVAGKRRGAADDRWLWPEALAVVDRIRPAWVLFENPTGILSLNNGVEFERICLALEGQGYEVQSLVIPACAIGAPHRRDRVWIIANGEKLRTCGECITKCGSEYYQPTWQLRGGHIRSNWLACATALCGVDDGLSIRVDKFRGLGNAIIPQVAYQLIKRMIEAEQ